MILKTSDDIRKLDVMAQNQTMLYAIICDFWVAYVQECYISEIEYAYQSMPNVKVKNAKTELEIDISLFELFESREDAERERKKMQALIDNKIPKVQRHEMIKAFGQMRQIINK